MISLVEVMGGQQHGDAVLGREAMNLRPEAASCLGIQPCCRLIEEEHLGPMYQPHGNAQLAAHAARVRA